MSNNPPTEAMKRRKRIATIARRRDFLLDLVERSQANSWDKGEVAALTWALEQIAQLYPNDYRLALAASSKEAS